MMFAAGAIAYVLSRGHVYFFPFILFLGIPLVALFRPPRNRLL